jgi:hypothetical protein
MTKFNIDIKKLKAEKRTLWVLISISGILVIRLFHFAWKYSVNMLHSDQWDFYNPLFTHQNIWQIFTWQHGPHRQGIGLIVTKLIAESTSWNSRADSLAIVALVSTAMVFAYILKYKLFGSLTLWDLTISLLFLTLFQYETIIITPNLSYGAFPILMIMLYCLTLLIQDKKIIKYTILLVLNFLLIYTGWGLFMGLITIVLLLVELYASLRARKERLITGVAALIAILSQLSFFINYHFNPAVTCFDVSTAYIYFPQYPVFMGLMLAAFFGLHVRLLGTLATPPGLVLLAILIFVFLYHARRIMQHGMNTEKVSLIIIILITYSALFCINTAIGRVCTGLPRAQVSRYVTLLIPAFLALYFHLITIKTTRLSMLILTTYIVMASIGSLPLGVVEGLASQVHDSKANWKSCYLQTYDTNICDQMTSFKIYPAGELLADRMEYLKENHLNLFADDQ